jgi:hypothetical protein
MFSQYAPEYRLTINAAPLPPALRASITRVSHQEGIVGSDRVELTIANPGLRWLDHPLLQVDNGLTLALGYAPQTLTDMFVGEITGVTPSFPSGGMPTVTVVAQDFLNRLMIGAKTRDFKISIPTIGQFPLPDVVVADLVAATNLLVPLVDPAGAALSFLTLMLAYAVEPLEARRSIRIEQPYQSEETDFDFLTRVSRDNGWEMSIDHTFEPRGYVLHFRSLLQNFSPSVSLAWGQSLIDFTPRLSTVGQVAGVATRLWVPSIKIEFVIVLAWDYDRAAFDFQIYPSLGDLGTVLGGKSQQYINLPPGGPAEIPKMLLSELLPRLNNRLTGTGTALGNTGLRAGAVVNFDGLGGQFGGLYRITSVTNTIDNGGFRTAFEVRKEVWFGSVPVPRGIGGLARVQGQRVG